MSYFNFTGGDNDPRLTRSSAVECTTVTLYGFAACCECFRARVRLPSDGFPTVNRFATFFQTIEAAVAAELYDGYNYNCEANSSFNCFSSGGPGLQVGLSTHNTAKSDDTNLVQSYGRGDLEWNQLCGAGLLGATTFLEGYNHIFVNYYSRGDTVTGANSYQFTCQTGTVQFIGGEWQANGPTSANGAGGLVYVYNGAVVTMEYCAFTDGTFQLKMNRYDCLFGKEWHLQSERDGQLHSHSRRYFNGR